MLVKHEFSAERMLATKKKASEKEVEEVEKELANTNTSRRIFPTEISSPFFFLFIFGHSCASHLITFDWQWALPGRNKLDFVREEIRNPC